MPDVAEQEQAGEEDAGEKYFRLKKYEKRRLLLNARKDEERQMRSEAALFQKSRGSEDGGKGYAQENKPQYPIMRIQTRPANIFRSAASDTNSSRCDRHPNREASSAPLWKE